MEAGKRKDIMTNIQERLNSGQYNNSRKSRNVKDVMEKVKAYEKKEREGKFRGYMQPRYDAAKALLERLQGQGAPLSVAPTRKRVTLKKSGPLTLSSPPVAESAPSPKAASPKAASPKAATARVPSPVAAAPPRPPSPKKFTLKKRRKHVEFAAPEFNPPPANKPSMPVPRGEYTRNGEFRSTGVVSPRSPGGNINIQRFSVSRKKNRPNRNTTVRKHKKKIVIKEENMKYLEEASKEFLPLPELYNPFDGRKYAPEEDPHPDIERAHYMLEDILEKAKAKALVLKRRATRKSRGTKARAAI